MDDSIQATTDSLDEAAHDLERYVSPYYWRNLDFKVILEGILLALIIFVIGHIVINIISKILVKLLRRRGASRSGTYYIEKFLKFLLYFLLIIIIFNVLGISSATLLAILISLAVALVLALRGSLTDIASGIMILVTRPIKEGDKVFLEDVDDFLTVREIRFFNTYLVDRKKRLFIVPNERIMQNIVYNLSDEDFVYTDVSISVAYDSDLDKVKEVISDTLDKQEGIIKSQKYIIGIENFGDSGIDYLISFPVRDEDYMLKKLEVREALKFAFDENNIEIPYNLIDINIINRD